MPGSAALVKANGTGRGTAAGAGAAHKRLERSGKDKTKVGARQAKASRPWGLGLPAGLASWQKLAKNWLAAGWQRAKALAGAKAGKDDDEGLTSGLANAVPTASGWALAGKASLGVWAGLKTRSGQGKQGRPRSKDNGKDDVGRAQG